jgi:chemotaxis protein MotB
LSSAVLFDRNDPLNPVNRRISIVVMNKQAEESLNKQGAGIAVGNADDLNPDKFATAPAKL